MRPGPPNNSFVPLRQQCDVRRDPQLNLALQCGNLSAPGDQSIANKQTQGIFDRVG